MQVSYNITSPQTITNVAYTYLVIRNLGRRIANVTVFGRFPQTFQVRQGEVVELYADASQTETLIIDFGGLTDRLLNIIAVNAPGGGGILGAKNGLSLDGAEIILGGVLDRGTEIVGSGFGLEINGLGEFILDSLEFNLGASTTGFIKANNFFIELPSSGVNNRVLTVVNGSTKEVAFVDPNSLVSVPIQGASNGLSVSGMDVILGGTLVQDTIIAGDGTQNFALEDLDNISISAGQSYDLNTPSVNITTGTTTSQFEEVTQIETSLTVDVSGTTATPVVVIDVAPGQVITLETDIHYLRSGQTGTGYVKRYEGARRPSGGGAVEAVGADNIVDQDSFGFLVPSAGFSGATNATQYLLQIDNNSLAATGRYKIKLRLTVSEIPDTF